MSFNNTTSKWLNIFSVLLVLGMLALTTGCGGGGGGGAVSSVPAPGNTQGGTTTRPNGQANFTVVFPPKDGQRSASVARDASALPPEAQSVTVQVFGVKNGVREQEPEEEKTMQRPGDNGGAVSVRFVLPVGRYIAIIKSKDANGRVLGVATEPVRIQALSTTSVPTTLGIAYTKNGFEPSQITLKTGERLVVHHDGELEGDFRLAGVSDCKGNIARTGSLACTLRQAGTFELRAPGGTQKATITVVQDDNLLVTAKPSLGVQRSEGVAERGPFVATFFINNGGQAFPAGAVFDAGDGRVPLPLTPVLSVSYNAGSFVAAILDSNGNALAQRYLAVYPPAVPVPTSVVTLASLPPQVTSASLLVAGQTNPPVISGRVIVENAGAIYSALTDDVGAFSLNVALKPGNNPLKAYLVNSDGVPGPKAEANVELLISTQPGALAYIEVEGLPDVLTAGVPIEFQVFGFDALDEEVELEAGFQVEGLEIQVLGPASFLPVTAGDGQLVINGPGGVRKVVDIHVRPGALAKLVLAPGNFTVRAGDHIQLTVFAKDAFGNVFSELPPLTFSGTTNLQSVDPSGSIVPTQTGAGVVKVHGPGGLSADACISVNPALPPEGPPPPKLASH